MLRRSALYSIALAGCVLATTEALAQTPAWAVGTWKGSIQGLQSKDGPDRILIIGTDGKCRWDIASSAKPSPQTCTVGANSVSVSPGPGSMVEMQYKNGRLDGTWQTPRSGRSYVISMTKQ